MEIDILAGEFRMRVKELEVSHLESTLKKVTEHNAIEQAARNTADNNVINSVSDPKVSCIQQ